MTPRCPQLVGYAYNQYGKKGSNKPEELHATVWRSTTVQESIFSTSSNIPKTSPTTLAFVRPSLSSPQSIQALFILTRNYEDVGHDGTSRQ